jgi:hypothetical protein
MHERRTAAQSCALPQWKVSHRSPSLWPPTIVAFYRRVRRTTPLKISSAAKIRDEGGGAFIIRNSLAGADTITRDVACALALRGTTEAAAALAAGFRNSRARKISLFLPLARRGHWSRRSPAIRRPERERRLAAVQERRSREWFALPHRVREDKAECATREAVECMVGKRLRRTPGVAREGKEGEGGRKVSCRRRMTTGAGPQ